MLHTATTKFIRMNLGLTFILSNTSLYPELQDTFSVWDSVWDGDVSETEGALLVTSLCNSDAFSSSDSESELSSKGGDHQYYIDGNDDYAYTVTDSLARVTLYATTREKGSGDRPFRYSPNVCDLSGP